MFKRSLSIFALATACWATASGAQTQVENPPDPWIHGSTGVEFPASIGQFKRGRVIEYSEDGRDASAGYSLRRGSEWVSVTIYIYPVIEGMDCPATFADAKQSIASRSGAVLAREARVPGLNGRGERSAYYASYNMAAGAMGEAAPAGRSELYVHCPADGKWLVKYRATWTAGDDFSKDVDTLIDTIEWPAQLAD